MVCPVLRKLNRSTKERAKTVVSALNSLLKTVDKNGDQQIDAAERGALEQYVEDTYGQQWLTPLKQVLDQADADADAVLTKAEWDQYAESPAPDKASKETVMVTMSDGIRLATDIHLPAGDGPWPVILMRTPYNKDSSGHNLPGAVTVIQDHRGRFASEGWNLPFVGCGWDVYHDGKDTVDWIRRQPWCDGRVFSVGGSALGITQNYLAAAEPDGLQSQYIVVAAADLYQHAIYVGGAYRQSQVEGWVTGNKFDAETLRTYKAHPTKDRFWARFDSLDRESKINVPATHVGGWFDTFSLGTVQSYRSRQHHGGPDARGKQKLVMGPWTHGVGQPIKIRDDTFPNHDVPGRYTTGDWARQTVLGEDTGYLTAPAVAYYALGDVDDPKSPGNEWRYADDWPIPCAPTSFYLHADGSLSQEPPAEHAESDSRPFVFDPDDPCPTRGGCNLVIEAGPLEQNDIEGRDDVLTFTTAPLGCADGDHGTSPSENVPRFIGRRYRFVGPHHGRLSGWKELLDD